MLRMFRLRRYRIFLIIAAVSVLLIFKWSKQRHWIEIGNVGGIVDREGFPVVPKKQDNAAPLAPVVVKTSHPPPPVASIKPSSKKADIAKTSSVVGRTKPSSSKASIAKTSGTTGKTKPSRVTAEIPTLPPLGIPDRKGASPKGNTPLDAGVDEIHPVSPDGRQEDSNLVPIESPIYYVKHSEHFPVPTESIIRLPTGLPVAIPKIQHAFNDETTDAKIDREKRQIRVKAEFKRAWEGYRKNAWLHDELSPVTGKFRDPFCGWAATLVDSLDTLWIMGLEEEFDAAAKAVNQIDFTTTTRADIPMFETTIRYLGGLVAAYDVSGGKYKNLLDKAVELADILMGAFDTPNRMPQLYYKWKPTFASQPHRADTRASIAELGSMSMEFTRLAQLTKEPRFYDAVARITIALDEYGDRGTRIPGLFPENIDASGCNKTIVPPTSTEETPVSPARVDQEPEGYRPEIPGQVPEPIPDKKPVPAGPGTLEMDVVPGAPGAPAKALLNDWEEKPKVKKRGESVLSAQTPISTDTIKDSAAGILLKKPGVQKDPLTGLPLDLSAAKAELGENLADWDCVPQGLTSSSLGGSEKFSMGGGQDSTYEYFPKQWLLLGGREEVYKKLYLKTIAAVKKHLIYRPMVPNDRDILFSGSISAFGSVKEFSLTAEVEHLTCFIGGMVGMSAKIFGLEQDLELAKKLADGCVWAYESTATGIMPEGAQVVPCESVQSCPWNETTYHQALDPMWKSRDKVLAEYLENTAKAAAESEALKISDEKETVEIKAQALEAPEDTTGTEKIAKRTPPTTSYDEKVISTEAELRNNPPGRQSPIRLKNEILTLDDPIRPLSHKEYVADRIKTGRLPTGMVTIRSKAYILRPEAIESVWYMYRITGDPTWQEKGWKMFESIINATSTKYGHSSIHDVTDPEVDQTNIQESFWTAETLKYFYLLYSTPDTISLDDYVFNTEAHPFKREV